MSSRLNIEMLFGGSPPEMSLEERCFPDLIQLGYLELARQIADQVPETPEQTLALRKLHEAFLLTRSAIEVGARAAADPPAPPPETPD